MEPKAFADTVRATCMPNNATNEEFAAFLMVAKDYGLNPITREIYAFPKKGGGIQPIVGIDGFLNIINSHPQCDGIETVENMGEKGDVVSVTCTIHRKDRNRPTVVTEYMEECKRPTEPWQKWPKRMLRHKATIQCARYAFGFAGIIDPEEAERSPEVITGQVSAPPPPPQIASSKAERVEEAEIVTETDEATDAILDDGEAFDLEAFLAELSDALATSKDADQVFEIWDGFDVEATLTGDEEALQRAFNLRAARLVQFNPVNGG
ncbi:MAG: phage recombination protein Bet [Rhizobiaceae bacterium]|nr:phage recombination protein Bet [Rhizobiaceae bacterium]